MSRSFSTFLLAHPFMKVVSALTLADRPRCLRELVEITGLSPGGLSDVLRRLSEAGVVESTPKKNRVYFSIVLTAEEKSFIRYAVDQQRMKQIALRAERYSKRSRASIGWIDETVHTVKKGRRHERHSS